MMTRLSWRLVRSGGRDGWTGTLLAVVAVAVSTAMFLITVAAIHALGARDDRASWRNTPPASERIQNPPAKMLSTTTEVQGKQLSVVTVAGLGDRPPVPPGLPKFPAPGELWVSPTLADLMKRLPAEQLADRFPTRTPTGIIHPTGLVRPDELAAVVGDDARNLTTGTPIADFTGGKSRFEVYQGIAGIAALLTLVPLFVLSAAAARLTVSRRDSRLATLRLIGATPRQVRRVSIAEAALTAVVGAIAGGVLYGLLIGPLSTFSLAGGTWYAADWWMGVPILAAAVTVVPVIVVASAALGLRKIVTSPLGVARRQSPARMSVLRILALLVPIAAGAMFLSPAAAAALGVVLALLAFLGINVVGPWAVQVIGRNMVRTARTPSRLLAGRRLIDDPKSTWRTVGGIALTGFVAGVLAIFAPIVDTSVDGRSKLEFTVSGEPSKTVSELTTRLDKAGVRPEVDTLTFDDLSYVTVRVPESSLDKALTAAAGVVPGQSGTPAEAGQRQELADIRTAGLAILVSTFLIAAASAGITAMAAVLDRRQGLALLRLAGTPLSVLNRARRQETLVPLVVMGGTSIGVGALFATLLNATEPNLSSLVVLAGFVVAGVATVVAAGALSRPLLRAVTDSAGVRPD